MFDKRVVFVNLIFVIVQQSTFAEWVEVPQFSDSAKVYRVPFTKHDRGQNYNPGNRDGPKIYGNASSANGNFHRPLKQHYGVMTVTESIPFDVHTSGIFTTRKSMHLLDNGETIVTKSPHNDAHATDGIAGDNKDVVIVPTINLDDKIIVDNDQLYEAVSTVSQPEVTKPEVDENDKKPSFLAFIPIELFKKVHAILKSQSTTVEGKINFLKRFENTLLREIEKRLRPVFSPARRKRESRGDHGWDDHEKGVGFPSLEGALMAIAFLTFAVYLVQLVMMLFRNMGNNNNNNTNIPAGTATVLFNRNKRSIDQLNEDTVRILGYLDEFAKNQPHP